MGDEFVDARLETAEQPPVSGQHEIHVVRSDLGQTFDNLRFGPVDVNPGVVVGQSRDQAKMVYKQMGEEVVAAGRIDPDPIEPRLQGVQTNRVVQARVHHQAALG